MKKGTDIIMSIVAGAVGGALVMMLIQNSPGLAKFFQGSEPLVPQVLTETGETQDRQISVTGSESLVVNAVEKANPAVVSIVVTKDVPIIERYYEDVPGAPFDPFGDFFGGDDFFSPFNFRVPQYRQKGTEKREVGGGSGFIVSDDGLVVTNRHVVEQDGVEYTVFMNDGEKFDAQVLAKDTVHDLAVIKIDGQDLPYLEFGDANELKVGQTVIAIGNALAEFRNTVSVGVVSGLSRSITAGDGIGQAEQIDEVIQTDAAINPGNSGGPLLNTAGQVVGVNVAMALGSENIGFALPANAASNIVDSVKETGRIVRPYVGVRYTMVTPVLVQKNNLPVDYGALITRGETAEDLAVMPGSPADKAGLSEGDIILEVDGVKLEGKTTLASIIRQHKVGDTLGLKLLSRGEEKTLNVTLKEIPQQ
jgi:serine protease Do